MAEFESFDVGFKIIYNKNKQVYLSGYVTINDEEAEDVDWYFCDRQGFAQPQLYIHHDGVDGFKGVTQEQQYELDTFRNNYLEDALWIDTVILQSEENENRTYVRENCTVIINDGAKMECEIIEHPEIDLYMVELIPKFNGEKIDLITYMKETSTDFDPWYVDDGKDYIEDGKIFFEMSSDYWEDSDSAQNRLKDVNEEARSIYAMFLTKELGIYSKYGEVMEQLMDANCDDEWLFKMSQMVDKSDEELDTFLKAEGFIDEELDY